MSSDKVISMDPPPPPAKKKFCPKVRSNNVEKSSVFMKIKNSFLCFSWKKDRRRKKTEGISCRFFGLFALVAFFLFNAVGCIIMWFTDIYLDQILNQMTLREGAQVFDAWREPPVKPLICVHLFNYTNMEEYKRNSHVKLKLDEVGPYCYRETLVKKNIIFNEDGTVTYGDTRSHKFEPQASKGNLSDIIIAPNMILIMLTAMTSPLGIGQPLFMFGINKILKYDHSTIRVTAKELIEGYDDKVYDFLKRSLALVGAPIPFDKFGLLVQRMTETKDTVTVRSGNKFLDKIGVVTKINDKEMLTDWSHEECNRIDGSDGAFFPRHLINESATLYLFHKDLCRRMPFVYDKEVDFQDGVMGMRFHASPTVYDTNGTCFCPTLTEPCSPKGVFDLSPCQHGVPFMTSFPHFLYGDPELLEPFEGLHPDPVKHEFYIDVQRLLGFTLGTVSRLQINIQVRKRLSTISRTLEDFPDNIILPVAWIQVSADRLPPDLFRYIYHSSVTVKQGQKGLQWGTLIFTILTGIGIYYVCNKNKRSFEPTKVDLEEKAQQSEMLPKLAQEEKAVE